MTQGILIVAAFATGALVPLQLAFNAQLGQVTRNAITASLVVFLTGAAALALALLVTRPSLPTPSALAGAPKTIWLGGLFATLYILAVVWVTPRLGVGQTAVLIISGQLAMALALDHFGAFNMPRSAFSWMRGLGILLVLAGVVTIRKG